MTDELPPDIHNAGGVGTVDDIGARPSRRGGPVIPGSYEARADAVEAAIARLALFGTGGRVQATLDDAVVVRVAGDSDDERYYRLGYRVGDDGEVSIVGVDAVDPATLSDLSTPAARKPAAGHGAGNGAGSGDGPGGGHGSGGGADDETKMLRKVFSVDPQRVAETVIAGVPGWTFEGYFTKWGLVDDGGDATVPGLTAESLDRYGLPPVKYEHGPTIGRALEIREDDVGAWIRAFVPADQATDFIRKLMLVGAVAKMSYGYTVLPGGARVRPDGVRELTSIRLMEVSPVAIPMLNETSITNVKASPNGLPDAPLSVQLRAVGAALTAARVEAEGVVTRRKAAGRAPGRDSVDAIAELGLLSLQTAHAMIDCEIKAGRALARPRREIVAQIISSIIALIESLPESERDEIGALSGAGSRDTAGSGGSAGHREGAGGDGAGAAAAARASDVTDIIARLVAIQTGVHQAAGGRP